MAGGSSAKQQTGSVGSCRLASLSLESSGFALSRSITQINPSPFLSFLTTTTSSTTTQTMQAAVQLAPPLLSQYSHTTLTRAHNANLSAMPTPPVPPRKRKRVQQYPVNYSEIQEVDSNGRLREFLVIEDTPPPPSTVSPATTHLYSTSYQPPAFSGPHRTRARAAAEAQAQSTSSSSVVAPPSKKRRREQVDLPGVVAKKPATNGHPQNLTNATNKSWASGSGVVQEDVSVSFDHLPQPLN